MFETSKRCENCKHIVVNKLDECMCSNPESEYIADYVELDFCCEDHEEED